MVAEDLTSSIATAEVSAATTVMATTAEYHDADGDGVGKGGVSERRKAGDGTGEDAGKKQDVGVIEMLRKDGYLDPETTGSG